MRVSVVLVAVALLIGSVVDTADGRTGPTPTRIGTSLGGLVSDGSRYVAFDVAGGSSSTRLEILDATTGRSRTVTVPSGQCGPIGAAAAAILVDCEVFSREIPVLVSAVSGRTELLPEHGPSDSPPGYRFVSQHFYAIGRYWAAYSNCSSGAGCLRGYVNWRTGEVRGDSSSPEIGVPVPCADLDSATLSYAFPERLYQTGRGGTGGVLIYGRSGRSVHLSNCAPPQVLCTQLQLGSGLATWLVNEEFAGTITARGYVTTSGRQLFWSRRFLALPVSYDIASVAHTRQAVFFTAARQTGSTQLMPERVYELPLAVHG
jgi:hypothetical protein